MPRFFGCPTTPDSNYHVKLHLVRTGDAFEGVMGLEELAPTSPDLPSPICQAARVSGTFVNGETMLAIDSPIRPEPYRVKAELVLDTFSGRPAWLGSLEINPRKTGDLGCRNSFAIPGRQKYQWIGIAVWWVPVRPKRASAQILSH